MASRKLIVSAAGSSNHAAAAGRHTDLPQEDPRAERESDRSGWAQVVRDRPLADLLRQFDDDPHRAADVAEPVAVLVALHLAHEFRAAGSQVGDDGVDVFDGECDMADARRVRRRVPVVVLARGPVVANAPWDGASATFSTPGSVLSSRTCFWPSPPWGAHTAEREPAGAHASRSPIETPPRSPGISGDGTPGERQLDQHASPSCSAYL